ncbi:MAG: trehalose-phosphatase [Candidatus Omnitrophica bacterium]|nr:trehalose-phosphatase [Candidatus Omnitrophota bacterium]
MRYLLRDQNKFFFKIKKSPHVFLFLDYDGTLTSIVSAPEKAKLPLAVKNSIKRLKASPGFTVAVISGRSLRDIKSMVGIKGLIYAGNHGLEIEGLGRRISMPAGSSAGPGIKKIKTSLDKTLSCIKGVRVEDKGRTLSVHFRLVRPGKRRLVKNIFRRIVRPYVLSKKIKLSSGKMVLEVRPAVEWDKGKAVVALLAQSKKALPVYIGDDRTDIDAFRALKGRGISIFVGRPKRAVGADYYLKSPRDVAALLHKFTLLSLTKV